MMLYKFNKYVLVVIILCTISTTALAQQSDLFFSPDTIVTVQPDTFYIQVQIDSVSDLKGYSIRVDFPELLLECLSAEMGNFLGNLTFYFPSINNSEGWVKVDQAILGSGSQSGSGILFRLKFATKFDGSGTFSFSNVDLRNTQNQAIAYNSTNGFFQIGVTRVPALEVNQFDNDAFISVFPNPFNNNCNIGYNLAEPQRIDISIFDITGRLIRNLTNADQSPGKYLIQWDGKNEWNHFVSTGYYFIRFQSKNKYQFFRISYLK